jgi:hypothetical protein
LSKVRFIHAQIRYIAIIMDILSGICSVTSVVMPKMLVNVHDDYTDSKKQAMGGGRYLQYLAAVGCLHLTRYGSSNELVLSTLLGYK